MSTERELHTLTERLLQVDVEDIDKDKAADLIEQFYEAILFHNRLYYVEAQPIISDSQYDKIFSKLETLEDRFPELITPASPTQTLQVELLDSFEQAPHTVPMLSLQNSYNEEDIADWSSQVSRRLAKQTTENFSFFVEPKYDGASVELIYNNGEFSQAVSRGDGMIGEDISEHIKLLPTVPRKLKGKAKKLSTLSLRGEVVMPKSAFEKLNQYQAEENLSLFANPRNATAGTLRQLDPSVAVERGLTAFVFEVLYASNEQELPKHDSELINLLEDRGFLIPDWCTVAEDAQAVTAICKDESIQEQLEKANVAFDGLVIKLNELSLREELGTTAHHPRWAIAFKYPTKQVVTKLQDITYQIGRTGVITPVAELDPVDLRGATIARATLHNFDYIEEKDIRKGDAVWIQRSGEVIPYVIGPVKEKRDGTETQVTPPTTCPSCGTELQKNEGEVALYCPNPTCRAKLKGQIKHFVSKHCLDIEGLGESIVELLVDNDLIDGFADLYRLTDPQKAMALRSLPGLADKKVNQIQQEIKKSMEAPLWRKLHGLGIPEVGKKMAQDLADHLADNRPVESVDELVDAMQDTDFLLELYGMGEQTAEAIQTYFSNDLLLEELSAMEEQGVQFVTGESSQKSDEMEGIRFAVTGSFDLMRDELTSILESYGARFTSSVSNKTSFLLVGENPGSKYEKAEKLSVPTYSLQDLLATYPFLKERLADSVGKSRGDAPSLFS